MTHANARRRFNAKQIINVTRQKQEPEVMHKDANNIRITLQLHDLSSTHLLHTIGSK